MRADELAVRLEQVGGLLCAPELPCEDGEILYTLMRGVDGDVVVSIRCGDEVLISPIADVSYIGRDAEGLEVVLTGESGILSTVKLRSGRNLQHPLGE